MLILKYLNLKKGLIFLFKLLEGLKMSFLFLKLRNGMPIPPQAIKRDGLDHFGVKVEL